MLLLDARYLRQPRSGIPRYTLNLLRALKVADPGRQVRILVPHHDALPRDLAGHGPFDPVIETSAPRDPVDIVRWPRRVRRLGASVVHCPDAFAPLRSRVPVALTLHDLIPLICTAGLEKSRKQRMLPLWRRWLKLQTRCADAIVTVSKHSADDLQRLLKIPPEKIHLIPNAVPPPADENSATPSPQASPPFDTGDSYLLCVGRFDPYKNVPGLIEAFARLVADLPSEAPLSSLKLVLVGSPDPRYPQAQNTAARLGLADRVVFTGQVSDEQLETLYKNAAMLVMPSLYEGFGLPAVEAMRRGVPVVVSDRGSLPEVVGDAAVITDATNPKALAEAMRRVLANPALAGKLVARGREHARRYDPANIGRQYLDFLDRLIHAGRKKHR